MTAELRKSSKYSKSWHEEMEEKTERWEENKKGLKDMEPGTIYHFTGGFCWGSARQCDVIV